MNNHYVQLLKKHNLKITPQRLEILKYLEQHHTHPTADDIYTQLKKTNPSLSKTTVYNALETLKNNNLIQTLTISGTETRYDYKTTLHHHLLCKNCNKIIDIDIECPNINKIQQDGYQIHEVHGYFKGICKTCQQQMGE